MERETHVFAALGAGAFDVTIREEPLVLLAVKLLVLVLLHPAVLVQLQEDVLADPAQKRTKSAGAARTESRAAYTVC